MVKKLKANCKMADTIMCITCYGVQIGLLYPLKILKLSVDFEKGTTTFVEQFRCVSYVDACINYVLKHIRS